MCITECFTIQNIIHNVTTSITQCDSHATLIRFECFIKSEDKHPPGSHNVTHHVNFWDGIDACYVDTHPDYDRSTWINKQTKKGVRYVHCEMCIVKQRWRNTWLNIMCRVHWLRNCALNWSAVIIDIYFSVSITDVHHHFLHMHCSFKCRNAAATVYYTAYAMHYSPFAHIEQVLHDNDILEHTAHNCKGYPLRTCDPLWQRQNKMGCRCLESVLKREKKKQAPLWAM